MSDEADDAQATEAFLRDRAIAASTAQVAVAGCEDCVDCDRKISAARLRAIPSARRCAKCQELVERRRGKFS